VSRGLLIPVTAGLLTVAAGCATDSNGPGFTVLSTRRATGPLAAEAVYPLRGGDWVYLVTEGDGSGDETVHHREATERHRAAWADHQSDRRSEYWRPDDDGNLVMPVVVDHANNAVSMFRPPLVVAYARMEPGRTYEQEVRMRVMDARRPDRQRYLGTATQTIVYADDQVLRTPLGELVASRLSIHFSADLGSAGAKTTTTLWIVPGVGPVVLQRSQSERVLGIPVRGKSQTLVLVSPPVPLPPPEN
jgi:hypothetical protein